jgi:hypothetical protein
MLLTVAFIPSLSIQGKHLNIGIVVIGLSYTMECINSSMNIFIYYHMSSKYRDFFSQDFLYTNKQEERIKEKQTRAVTHFVVRNPGVLPLD